MAPCVNKYNLPVVWDDEYKRLDYIQEQFNDPIKLAEWETAGYKNVATGFMCDMRSPQPSWNDQIVQHFAALGWKDIGTSYYRMSAGTILPEHSDLYKKYVELFDLYGREHTIRRAIIMLEDWKPGHYLDVNGVPMVDWRAGQVVEWMYDTPHTAANIGLEDRYSLQITGHL
jgi:hypothetical protein